MFIKLIPRRYPLNTHLFVNAHSVQVDPREFIYVLDSEARERVFSLGDFSIEIFPQASAPEVG